MGAVPKPRLFLIDSFGFIFRAYHARARSGAPPMRTSTGFSTEAVYIFNNMLRKLSKQYSPAYIAAIFESSEATHRVQEFAEYKANRVETPPDLLDQIPFVRRILEAMSDAQFRTWANRIITTVASYYIIYGSWLVLERSSALAH